MKAARIVVSSIGRFVPQRVRNAVPNRLRRAIGRLLRESAWSGARALPVPQVEAGRVIFTLLGEAQLRPFAGKVSPDYFFPPFCRVLAEHGIRSFFVDTEADLARLRTANTAIVHIFDEVFIDLGSDGIRAAQGNALVFNEPDIGRLINNKTATNRTLSQRGILMPEIIKSADGPVFSNALKETKAETQILDPGAPLDPARYNTTLIDTRISFSGRSYYTSARLMCVGPTIVHAWARARPVEEGSASVHSSDMPIDADLAKFLYQDQIEPNQERFAELAEHLYQILGPGFYAHDLLIETGTDRILLCETGFKFCDLVYPERLKAILKDIPMHAMLGTAEFPERSALAFLDLCRARGMAIPTLTQPTTSGA